MATDGGQSRTKGKLLAEQNHSRTVTTTDVLTSGRVMVSGENNTIVRHPLATATGYGILITDAAGNASFLAVPSGPAGYNKLLAVLSDGTLGWIDR